MEGTPLLDVMRGLILEPEAQAEFAADPSGYMQRFGYEDVPEDDMREAVGLVADTLPPDVAHAVTTAAAAPADDDGYGDGSVGILGRISTAEVTESVVPELDDLPPDDASLDDEHDATAFGDVTRDFDDDTADQDTADQDGDADNADDPAAVDRSDEAGDDDAEADDDGSFDDAGSGQPDLSFGDATFDDDPAAFEGTDAAEDTEDAGGFGQGSTADDFTQSDDGYGTTEPLDTATDDGIDDSSFDDGGFDSFDSGLEDAPDYADDPSAVDSLDDVDIDDTPDDDSFDDDVGSF